MGKIGKSIFSFVSSQWAFLGRGGGSIYRSAYRQGQNTQRKYVLSRKKHTEKIRFIRKKHTKKICFIQEKTHKENMFYRGKNTQSHSQVLLFNIYSIERLNLQEFIWRIIQRQFSYTKQVSNIYLV